MRADWDTFDAEPFPDPSDRVTLDDNIRMALVVVLQQLSPAERAVWDEYERLEELPTDQFMSAFVRLGLKPNVSAPPPPAGDPPPWMAKRPAGIRALMETFKSYDLDREALRRFDRPVYFALGGLSNPDQYAEIARRLGTVFADFELEVFEARHHFDPPHRIEPERLAESLQAHWRRAEASTPTRAAP